MNEARHQKPSGSSSGGSGQSPPRCTCCGWSSDGPWGDDYEGWVKELRKREIWTLEEVAGYLRVPIQTVYTWNKDSAHDKPYGPPYARIGIHARYLQADVLAWFMEHMRPVDGWEDKPRTKKDGTPDRRRRENRPPDGRPPGHP